MANPKYADLPGIAFDQPDVYETTDLPESDQLAQDIVGDHSDSIEKITLAPSEAYERFKDQSLINKDIDFTDSIASKRKTGYEFKAKDYETLGCGQEEETLEQKYKRLEAELGDLVQELSNFKEAAEKADVNESTATLQQQAKHLQEKLVGLNLETVLHSSSDTDLSNPFETAQKALLSQIENVKENLSNLNISSGDTEVPDNSVLSYELYLKPQLAAKSVDPYKVVHLEERIKKLETILGHDSNKLSALTTQTNDKSIVAAINILSARTALLDPSNLEQLEGRLGALQQRLATVASSRTTEEAMGGRVSELYDLAKRADTLGANVPGLLDHLLAVKDLHVQALQFSKALTHLDTSQQQMSASLQRSEKLLNEVQKSTVSNLETIQNNISNLEKRLAALK